MRFSLVWVLAAWFFVVARSEAQEPVDPAGDAELRSLIAEAAAAHGDAPAVVVLDRTRVRVEKSGLGHTDQRTVVLIQEDRAARDQTTLRFDYDPQSNVVDVRRVRILRADGSVREVALESVVDLPQPQRAIYWGARMKLVRVPRLAPGDALEVVTYKKGFMIAYLGDDDKQATGDERYVPPMRGHYYDVVAFGAGRPIHRKHYTVQTVRETPLQYEIYNGAVQAKATVTDDANIHSFWLEGIPAFRAEPNAPRANDQLPKVVMATVRDWREKSRWFFGVNESQFAATPGIKAKVAELLEGKETDRDRIAAIVHWCANEIRYSGITMGKGEGYTIHPSAMTFRDRCGVCKDKAGIAVTMLREAGYSAFAAMTMAGERVESIPADQFNHCVLAVRLDERVSVAPKPQNGVFTDDKRYWLLDPTWVVFSPELWSSAESEQHVLIGTKDGEDLTITPSRPASHNRLVIRGTSTLKPGGLVEGKLTITATSYADQRVRRAIVHRSAIDRRALFESWVGNLAPDAELVGFTDDYDALRDVRKPIALEVRYRLPGYWLPAAPGARFAAPLSHHPIRDAALVPYWGRAKSDDRKQPLFLWNTREVVLEERIAVPAGYKVHALPSAIELDHPAASLRAEWRQEGDGIVFAATIRSRQRTVAAADYAGFRDVVRMAGQLARDIVLER